MPIEIQQNYHSLAELAATLGVAYQTVWKWVTEERIAAVRFGKQYRISHPEFKNILEKGIER